VRSKVDENLPVSLCLLPRESHLDFDTVQDEGLSGKPDRIVMEACRGEGLALITLDVGFANQILYPAGEHPGVIVIRMKNQAAANIISAMTRFLAKQADLDDLAGCTVIVEEQRFRVRKQTLERLAPSLSIVR
jgi:predicted nuclease of predicted toxin-antitoxin system